jgi:hypothetical protein
MAIQYTKMTSMSGVDYIQEIDETGIVSFIPIDPANADYQAYLASLEE